MSFGLHRYGPLLRTRGAWPLLVSSFTARLGQFGTGVALLLAVHAASGSFGIAGSASGLLAGGLAASRVVQGRLIDRHGAAHVLAFATALFAATAAVLVAVLAAGGATAPTLVLSAAIGATLPAIDTVARMAWVALASDPHERTRAYSLESMTTELAAIAGPSCAGVVATAISSVLALGAALLMTVAGAVALARCRVVRPLVPRPGVRVRGGGFVRSLAVPAAAMLGLGLMFGALEVAIPAFADEHGAPGATGPLYAALAAGGVVGGLWHGSRVWRARHVTRLVVADAVVSACCALLLLASGPAGLGALLVLLGLSFPAALTTIFLLTDERIPSERRGEAVASVTAALLTGIALGSALSGWVAAHEGARASLALAAALSLTALVAAAWGARRPDGRARAS